MPRSHFEHPITIAEFDQLVAPLIGLPVSRPWKGYGSALFLELGELSGEPTLPTRREPEGGTSLSGVASVMIEWSWRVEQPRSIGFGSWSKTRKMNAGIRKLEGLYIRNITVEGRIPELMINLSSKLWVHAFSTFEGQPDWAVFLPDESWICVRAGKLHRNTQKLVPQQ